MCEQNLISQEATQFSSATNTVVLAVMFWHVLVGQEKHNTEGKWYNF